MGLDSNQVNQMIGGQQVMFANQASYAHNIGASAGITPPGAPGGFAPISAMPSYSYAGASHYGAPGSAAIGALGGALPGMASGLSVAGSLGLLGHMGGYLDPLTGTYRAARAGYAMGGLSGGLAAGGLAAGGFYAAGKVISHVGENLYAGAQNITQVGAMAQQFAGPVFGEAGARLGGGMARGQIQQITGILHEIAGQDTMTSMRDLKTLMDQAGQFGMLTGFSNAADFKTKFKRVVDQAKQVAQVLGTTIGEAMPTLQGFQQMGMWSTQDVMGGAFAMKMVGPGASQNLMNTMRMGAQNSHAMGGSLAAGTNLAMNQFLNVRALMSSGALSNEGLTEYTGGVGGDEGQEMLAKQLTGIVQSVSQSRAGQLTMSALGEFKNGEFTGRIDKDMLAKLQSGKLSVDDMQRIGSRNASTREGAASFMWRQGQIGQELMSQGGLEAIGGMFGSVLNRADFNKASDSIQGRMLQQTYGLNTRDAQMIQKILKDLPRMQEERSRKELAAAQDMFRQMDERRNKSYEGLKEAVGHAYEETLERPIQELGEKMSTSLSETTDKLTDYFYGRVRQMNISQQERNRILMTNPVQAGETKDLDRLVNNYRASSIQSNYDTGIVERVRRGGISNAFYSALLPYSDRGVGTRAEDLVASGASTASSGTGELPTGAVEYRRDWTRDTYIPMDEVKQVTESIRARAGSPTQNKFFNSSAEVSKNLEIVKTAYSSILSDPKHLAELKEKKKELSPAAFAAYLTDLLREKGGPAVERALGTLHGANARGSKASLRSTDQDVLSVVQSSEGWKENFFQADFKAVSLGSGADMEKLLTDGAAFSAEVDAKVDNIMKTMEGSRTFSEAVGALGKNASAQAVNELRAAGDTAGYTATQFRDFIEGGGKVTEELQAWLSEGGGPVDPGKYPELYQKTYGAGRDEKISGLVGSLGSMNETKKRVISGQIKDALEMKRGKVLATVASERGTLASEEIGSLGEGAPAGLRDILGKFVAAGSSKNPITDFLAANTAAEKYAAGLSDKEYTALRGMKGPIAEHLADLAQIGKLKLTGAEKGTGIPKELQDELAVAQQVLPSEEKAKLEGILKGKGKYSAADEDYIKKVLMDVEKRLGPEVQKNAQDAQTKFIASLTGFAGASEKFVTAVSVAVPNLKDVTVKEVTDKARETADNGNATKKP